MCEVSGSGGRFNVLGRHNKVQFHQNVNQKTTIGPVLLFALNNEWSIKQSTAILPEFKECMCAFLNELTHKHTSTSKLRANLIIPIQTENI